MRKKKFYREEAKRLVRILREEKLFLRKNLTKEFLCKRLGLSSMQLHVMFKRNFGESYSRYMNRWRVEEAKLLLADPANGDKSKQEIAQESGFNSISQFNIHFKRITGMTPTEYELFNKHFKRISGHNLNDYFDDGRL